MSNVFSRRVAATIASLALAAGLAVPINTTTGVIPTPVAAAQENFPEEVLINPDTQGSLTIHKLVGKEDTDNTPTGETQDPPNGTEALAGVTYTITQLEADLTTNEGFAKARELTVNSPAKADAQPRTADTAQNGEATFENLPVGVYKVEETKVPAGVVPAAPFIVFVPMTGSSRAEWNYDVHVYPKNSKVEITKAVVDVKQQAGGTLTYTLESDLPRATTRNGQLQNFKSYIIEDQLDQDFFKDTGFVVTAALDSGTPALEKDTDYSVTSDAGLVKVTFTDAGLEKLSSASLEDPMPKVVTKIAAPLKNTLDGWKLTNTATLTVNNGAADTTVESDPVETRFANLTITKKDPDGQTLSSSPTDFQLIYCDAKGAPSGTDYITVGGKSTFTTENGTVTINGIHVTDMVDNAPVAADNQLHYCLIETKAPEGYELLPKPVPVEITSPAEADTAVDNNKAAEITNVKETRVELPLTGGRGIWLLLLLGAAVIAAGFLYARRNTKRSAE